MLRRHRRRARRTGDPHELVYFFPSPPCRREFDPGRTFECPTIGVGYPVARNG